MARVVHFEILSDDPEKACRFYSEALGWQVQTWGSGAQAYWLMTTGPDSTTGINGGIMRRHFAQAVINTVQVVSLKETTANIEAAGGRRVDGPNEIPGIGMHCYFSDTDGNLFGVLEPTAPAKVPKTPAKAGKKHAPKVTSTKKVAAKKKR